MALDEIYVQKPPHTNNLFVPSSKNEIVVFGMLYNQRETEI
jgi:hypothetical protein